MSNEQTWERVHCNVCGHESKHERLAKRERSSSETIEEPYEMTLDFSVTSEVFECAECAEITLRRTEWFSEWEQAVVTLHPPRTTRRLPHWTHQLPAVLTSLIEETYGAMHVGSRRLAMMGTRAVFDIVATDKIGDVGGFDSKLRAMMDQRLITSGSYDILKKAVDAGHAASHRAYIPTAQELEQVLDIMERLLHDVYVPWPEADKLDNIPRRKKP